MSRLVVTYTNFGPSDGCVVICSEVSLVFSLLPVVYLRAEVWLGGKPIAIVPHP